MRFRAVLTRTVRSSQMVEFEAKDPPAAERKAAKLLDRLPLDNDDIDHTDTDVSSIEVVKP